VRLAAKAVRQDFRGGVGVNVERDLKITNKKADGAFATETVRKIFKTERPETSRRGSE
jgi:hypothetical protein